MTFMEGRVNGQYIMEGIAAAIFIIIGGLGFILLDKVYSGRIVFTVVYTVFYIQYMVQNMKML